VTLIFFLKISSQQLIRERPMKTVVQENEFVIYVKTVLNFAAQTTAKTAIICHRVSAVARMCMVMKGRGRSISVKLLKVHH